ncbi:MAG: hypothetical protein ACO28Z_05510 [Opitutales bacterium]
MTAFLSGCSMIPAQDRHPQEIRRIFVREPAGSLTDELKLCGEAAHDSAVRRLRSLGYQDATEEAGADATLEAGWVSETDLPADGRPRVTLRLVLKSRTGEVLFATQVAQGTLLSFLGKDRVAEETGRKITELGKAPFVR